MTMRANISTSSAAHRTYSFGEFTLDLDRGALLSAGADVKLRPKSFEVLCYLVERQGLLVTKDELLDAIWGQTIVTEDSVTHCLIDIRKAIGDRSQNKIRTVPRRGYIFDLPVTASEEPSGTKLASRWPSWRFAAALILMLGVATVWWGFGNRGVEVPVTVEPQSVVAPHSIAVLPFLDMSPEQDQAYFADGISEEILNLLAQIPELRVIARTSSFSFKGQNVDIATVADKLNVTHVLEGSVRKDNNNIRITAQLVNASSSDYLWSEMYDRELESIFAVQDEISAAIVGALQAHLELQVEAAPRVVATANTEAHEAYLRGRYLVTQRTPATVAGAVREFEKAIALDPDYARAHAELALATLLLIRAQYGDLTRTEAIARAAPNVERAMALDPGRAEAHAAAGRLVWMQGNLEEALSHFEKAIQINPNYSIVHTWMANLLDVNLGRYEEAFAMRKTGLRLDPLSIPALGNYIGDLIVRNRLAEAERELEKFVSIRPTAGASSRGTITSLGGKWANSVMGHLDAVGLAPQMLRFRTLLSFDFAAIGLEQEALAISERPRPYILSMLGRPGDAVATAEARFAEDQTSLRARGELGLALAGAGDYARARTILEEIWQQSGGRVTQYGWFKIGDAAALIAIRRDAGEEADAGELVAAIRDNVHRYHEAGITGALLVDYSVNYEEGLAAYLADERESGLALIAKGADDGYFIPQKEAYLQTLYDDPGFAPIRASQEARQKREREKFLAIVCTDNPYEAVWQPAEATCDQFVAAGKNNL